MRADPPERPERATAASSIDDARRHLADLGYKLEFTARGDRLHCHCGWSAHPGDIVVEAVVRVAGPDGTPSGQLLGVDCLSCGVKGVLWVPRGEIAEESIAVRVRRLKTAR